MNTFEFSGRIEDGIIRLPKKHGQYDNAHARIIVLVDEPHKVSAKKELLRETFQKMKKADMFNKIDNPTLWQKQVRDEWE